MPAAHCSICLTHIPIDSENRFIVFLCGHGWCKDCTESLFQTPHRGALRCPNCRKPLHRHDGHPLFIALVDDSVAYAETLVEGLNRIAPDTPLVSVRKASRKLEKVAADQQQQKQKQGDGGEDSSSDNGNTNNGTGADLTVLLKAIEDFRERIIPLYAKTEDQQNQLSLLLAEQQTHTRLRTHLQSKIKKLEPLHAKVAEMEKAVQESDRQKSEALLLAETASERLGKAHESLAGWKKSAEDLQEENQRLKDSLERHNANAQLQKSKNKRLKEQLALMARKLEAAEREPVSDVTHGYDGDFSEYEHSRTERSLALSSPNRPFQQQNENQAPLIKLDFIGMPPPKFPSEWQIHKEQKGGALKKLNRRPPESRLPLDLDKNSRPTKAVVLGPKHIVRVSR